MSDRTKDIWNDDDGAGEEKTPRRHWLRSFLGFLLTLTVVLLVVLAAAWRDGTGFDALRRYFAYGSASSGTGGSGYVYDVSAQNRFAAVGNRLVVLSDTALSVLADDGSVVWSTSVKMSAPALSTGGGWAAAYDAGGTELYVVDEAGLRYQLQAGSDEPYLSATLNDSGLLAVTYRKKNYKGAVTVYDRIGGELFTFNSSKNFVADARATNDGKRLVAVTLGQSGGEFVSNVVIYEMSKEEPQSRCSIPGGLALAMGQAGENTSVVCDNCLALVTPEGNLEAQYSFANSYLREYDLAGDGCSVLLLNRYRSGNTGRLVTVDDTGREMASLDIDEEIRCVTAAGRYIAVLYGERLVIYNQMLEVYATLSGTDRIREVLILENGSALLAAAGKATRFLP